MFVLLLQFLWTYILEFKDDFLQHTNKNNLLHLLLTFRFLSFSSSHSFPPPPPLFFSLSFPFIIRLFLFIIILLLYNRNAVTFVFVSSGQHHRFLSQPHMPKASRDHGWHHSLQSRGDYCATYSHKKKIIIIIILFPFYGCPVVHFRNC